MHHDHPELDPDPSGWLARALMLFAVATLLAAVVLAALVAAGVWR